MSRGAPGKDRDVVGAWRQARRHQVEPAACKPIAEDRGDVRTMTAVRGDAEEDRRIVTVVDDGVRPDVHGTDSRADGVVQIEGPSAEDERLTRTDLAVGTRRIDHDLRSDTVASLRMQNDAHLVPADRARALPPHEDEFVRPGESDTRLPRERAARFVEAGTHR